MVNSLQNTHLNSIHAPQNHNDPSTRRDEYSGRSSDGRNVTWYRRLGGNIGHHLYDRYNRAIVAIQDSYSSPHKWGLNEREALKQYNKTYAALIGYEGDPSDANRARISKHVEKLLEAKYDQSEIISKISQLFSKLQGKPTPDILKHIIQDYFENKKQADQLSSSAMEPLCDHNDPLIKESKENFFRLCWEISQSEDRDGYEYKEKLKELKETARDILNTIKYANMHIMITNHYTENSRLKIPMPGSSWRTALEIFGEVAGEQYDFGGSPVRRG